MMCTLPSCLMALASLTLQSNPATLVLGLEERWVGVWEPTCVLSFVALGGEDLSSPGWFGGGVAIVSCGDWWWHFVLVYV